MYSLDFSIKAFENFLANGFLSINYYYICFFRNNQTEKTLFKFAKLLEKRYPNPKSDILIKILNLYIESILKGYIFLQ